MSERETRLELREAEAQFHEEEKMSVMPPTGRPGTLSLILILALLAALPSAGRGEQ